jgi:hypothetical protein
MIATVILFNPSLALGTFFGSVVDFLLRGGLVCCMGPAGHPVIVLSAGFTLMPGRFVVYALFKTAESAGEDGVICKVKLTGRTVW